MERLSYICLSMRGDFELENNEQTKKEVARFEAMLRRNELKFFDVEQIDSIIQYYLLLGNIPMANKAIQIGLSQHPTSSELKFKNAQVLYRKGKLNESLVLLNELELIDKTNPEIYIFRAEILSELQDFDSSIANFEKALTLVDTEDRDLLFVDIASEFQNKGDTENALIYLKRAIIENPHNALAYLEIFFTLQMDNRVDEAIAFFQEVIDKDPYNHIPWYYTGLAYRELELYEKAIEAFDFVIVIDDANIDAYLQKAECYISLELYHHAIEILLENLPKTEFKERIYYTLGECYENIEDYELAIEYYQQTIKESPDWPDAWLGVGVCLGQIHQITEGIEYIKKAIELAPNNNEFQLVYAEFLQNTNRLKDAEEIYEKLSDSMTDNPNFWLDKSQLFFHYDDYNEAIDILQEGLAYLPESAELMFRLAGMLILNGQENEGKKWLINALSLNKKNLREFIDFYPELAERYDIIEIIQTYQ